MSELKACPFCGRIPDIEDCGEHRWFIRCKCGIAQDKLFFQKCDAVRAWNKRKELRVKDTNIPITDTISRQAAIDALDSEITVTGRANAEAVRGYVNLVADRIKRLPSAEPEIIRCKECKFYDHFWNGDWCSLKNIDVKDANDFCSRAKRRTDV